MFRFTSSLLVCKRLLGHLVHVLTKLFDASRRIITHLLTQKFVPTPTTSQVPNFAHTPLPNPQSGQVAVIVLLLMVVLLTIGLSLASRVTQDIFLSQQQTDSARVFNAAESGAEVALSQDFSTISGPQSGSGSIDGGKLAYNYTIIPRQELEQDLKEGETATVFVERAPIGNITIEWGANGDCSDASLILSTIYEEAGGIKARHIPITPYNCDRNDNFDSTAANGGGSPYKSTYDLDSLSSTVLYVRIKAVYNDTALKVTGFNLPDQQYLVRSQATNTEGTEQRTVEVTRGISAPPSFMDYSLYTLGSIEKNQ